MLDLGSTINIMSATVYADFQSHILHPADIVVQLVDHSLVRPIGIVKNILIRVNGLCFSADFYVINMDVNSTSSASPLSVLLRRPFLKIAKLVIDVDEESLSLRHREKIEKFFISNDSSTTNLICFSSVIFQDCGKHPKLGVLDGDSAFPEGYG